MGQPGARQNITETGRLAELKVRIYITLVLILCSEIVFFSVIGIDYFLDSKISQYYIDNLNVLAAHSMIPVPVWLSLLMFVLVRDLVDPNFEPLNAVIERTSPLWPWKGKLKPLWEWASKIYKKRDV